MDLRLLLNRHKDRFKLITEVTKKDTVFETKK